MKIKIIGAAVCLAASHVCIADVQTTFQKPSKPILELVDVQKPPTVLRATASDLMILSYRKGYPALADMYQDEIKLGGLRLNPKTYQSSAIDHINDLRLLRMGSTTPTPVKGLPSNPKIANLLLSPDESKLIFTNTTAQGVEVWLLNLKEASAKKLSSLLLNASLGRPITWSRDSQHIIAKVRPSDAQPIIESQSAVAPGPAISISEGKEASQNRTYPDLLKNKIDEENFVRMVRSELVKIDLAGKTEKIAKPDLYDTVSYSPDGNYLLLSAELGPFSYLVRHESFGERYWVIDRHGKLVKEIYSRPLNEITPSGFSSAPPHWRSIEWRTDLAASITFITPLDKGNPKEAVEYRDELFTWAAPFQDQPKSLIKSRLRMGSILWGDEQHALMKEMWYETRKDVTSLFNPSQPEKGVQVLNERNVQDAYSSIGAPQTSKNKYAKKTLMVVNGKIYFVGEGRSKEGRFPFVDEYDLATMKKNRLYQAKDKDVLEQILEFKDSNRSALLVQLQSKTRYPNYFVRTLADNKLTPLTHFENPYKPLENVSKEVFKYKRADGLDLSGNLYLPAGYDKSKKERLPLLIWAYPAEFKDKQTAAQVKHSDNEFTAPNYGSFVYWVNKGYAVLDDASFPIIGEGKEEPNDTFIKQLIDNADAAIKALDQMGYIDPARVAVGGHSYGAFMTANLLTHSNLFACGIARSGAYNRTLTPFGFQSEQRNFWEATDVYHAMSPFAHANKMKKPILLVHGEQDNNAGTFPIQTERYFQALKGLGAPARMVILPKESHGYRARENILHLLWEQEQFLDKCLAPKSPS